jgi:hypothetical protein
MHITKINPEKSKTRPQLSDRWYSRSGRPRQDHARGNPQHRTAHQKFRQMLKLDTCRPADQMQHQSN